MNLLPAPGLLRSPRGHAVAVVGGGKTGAAAARLLARAGACVTVYDDAKDDIVKAGLKKHGVTDRDDVAVVGGGLDGAAIAGAELVVLSPGVPRTHPALAAALQKVPFVNELELGLASLAALGTGNDAGVQVWAITGTNGKSTTTTMAGAIAQVRDPDAFVGGNLGTPLCAAVVDGLKAGTSARPRILVVELSSYQLETLHSFPVFAAAVTNLTPDHLDRYPSVDAYYAAKARLFSLVVEGGGFALNANDTESQRVLFPLLSSLLKGTRSTCHFDILQGEAGVELKGSGVCFRPSGEELAPTNPRLVGRHNLQNAAAAAALARLAGFSGTEILQGLQAWPGIAHRLERLGLHRGLTWWNDSKATNVDAAVTALKSFAATPAVHLIAGGTGKGSPYAPLVDASVGKVRAVYTIGKDAPAVAAAFSDRGIAVVDCGTMARACAAIVAAAVAGDHLLLAPACASFDQFRDYADRGDQLRAAFTAFVAGTLTVDAASLPAKETP